MLIHWIVSSFLKKNILLRLMCTGTVDLSSAYYDIIICWHTYIQTSPNVCICSLVQTIDGIYPLSYLNNVSFSQRNWCWPRPSNAYQLLCCLCWIDDKPTGRGKHLGNYCVLKITKFALPWSRAQARTNLGACSIPWPQRQWYQHACLAGSLSQISSDSGVALK